MNCKKAQSLLLLAESGECRARKKSRAEAHARHCSSCTAFRLETNRLVEAARSRAVRQADEGPSPFVMTRIKAYGREALDQEPAWWRRPVTRIAFAAGLLLLAGWWTLRPLGGGAGSSDRMQEVYTLVELMGDVETVAASQGAMDREEMLRSLAEQLLEIQGLSEGELSLEEWLAPPPTDPQSHNSRAPSSRTHV